MSFDIPLVWSRANVSETADVSAATGARSLSLWWQHFNDPVLTSLVTQALQSNNSVKNAQAVLQQARALLEVSSASLWPAVGASASAGRRRVANNTEVNSFAIGLDASWELDLFSVNRSALSVSEATARSSAASLGNVQVSIAAEVALAYIALRSSQARLAVARDNLVSLQETEQITRWRRQTGLASYLEIEQASAATEQTLAQIPTLQISIVQTSHALSVLTGQPPETLLALLAVVGPIPHTQDDLLLSIPAETLRQRPDVRAAEHLVTAAQARLSQADASQLPKFALSGSFALNAVTIGALTASGAAVSSLLAGVSLPVFDGGALGAQVRVQQAALVQAWLGYEATLLTALTEVENALVALNGDRVRLLNLKQAAASAGNAALMARQRYESGLIDFQIVQDTLRSQLATLDSVTLASAEVSADQVRLYKALGGGWRIDNEAIVPMSPAIADRIFLP